MHKVKLNLVENSKPTDLVHPLCEYCGYQLPDHEERCKIKIQEYLTADDVPHPQETFAWFMDLNNLTERQVWFIKCAIEAKNIVLPLREEDLVPEIFEQDYGISQSDMEKEISELSTQLKELKP